MSDRRDGPPLWTPADRTGAWARLGAWVCAVPAAHPDAALARLRAAVDACPPWRHRLGDWGTRAGSRAPAWGPTVVLTGDAKAGRSTLLNAILGQVRLRTAVRAATPVAVGVVARGVRWVEVPPGRTRPTCDGRVVVADVRQPLPRQVRLAGDPTAPTALVLTKLDRALEDAVLSDDPAAEVAQAVQVARRRAQERCAGPLQAWVTCDPRDGGEVHTRVLPALHPVIDAARARAAQRRALAARAALAGWVAALSPAPPRAWPPEVPVDGLARGLAQVGVAAALASVAHDRRAWAATLPAATHHELDTRVGQVGAALAALVERGLEAAGRARAEGWADATATVRAAVEAAWTHHTGHPAAAVPGAPPAPTSAVSVALAAGRGTPVEAASRGVLPGLSRLRRVAARRDDVRAAWDEVGRQLETDLGGALHDDVAVLQAGLRDWLTATVAALEAAGAPVLVEVEAAHTAERVAMWQIRDWLGSAGLPAAVGDSGERDGEARPRSL